MTVDKINDEIISLQTSLLDDYQEIDRFQQLVITKQKKLKDLQERKSRLLAD